MFCLRSWLPLLFIPTNASPLFIISFVTLTYILHRPCIYCSALLLILFISSCHWSDRCFFDLRGDWFAPRYIPTTSTTTATTYLNSTSSAVGDSSSSALGCDACAGAFGEDGSKDLAGYVFDAVNSTAKALAGAAVEEVQRRFKNGSISTSLPSSSSSVSSSSVSSIMTSTSAVGVSEEEWTGIGLGWLRSLLGRREWTLPCVDVKVRL